jgi:hypothetical protein
MSEQGRCEKCKTPAHWWGWGDPYLKWDPDVCIQRLHEEIDLIRRGAIGMIGEDNG